MVYQCLAEIYFGFGCICRDKGREDVFPHSAISALASYVETKTLCPISEREGGEKEGLSCVVWIREEKWAPGQSDFLA